MNLLQIVEKNFATLGLSPSNQIYPINGKVLFGFLVFECTTVSQFMYIFNVANGFMEYMEVVSATSGTIVMFICFVTIMARKTTIFESIDDINKLINTSEPIFFNLHSRF